MFNSFFIFNKNDEQVVNNHWNNADAASLIEPIAVTLKKVMNVQLCIVFLQKAYYFLYHTQQFLCFFNFSFNFKQLFHKNKKLFQANDKLFAISSIFGDSCPKKDVVLFFFVCLLIRLHFIVIIFFWQRQLLTWPREYSIKTYTF